MTAPTAPVPTGPVPLDPPPAPEQVRPGRVGAVAAAVGTRLLGSVAVLWGAVTATFLLVQLMPGDTIDVLLARTRATPEVRAELVAQYRLDDPLGVQYLAHLGRVLTGDLGQSFTLRRSVAQSIGDQLPQTLQLVAATLVLAVPVAVLLAVLSTGRRRWVRSAFSGVEALVVALPPFWLGLMLLGVFSFSLGWFPAIGGAGPAGLVLPAVALAAQPVAVIARVLREGALRALDEPFALSARARGLSERGLALRHVLRHAALPATSLLGWIAGSLIGGAVIIEIVFSRPGIGRLALSAVQNRDLPLIVGVVLLAAVVFVVVTVVVDVLTRLIDPRTGPVA